MHQQSRHPPRVSSPASSPQTNPTRTNNPRDRGRTGGSVASVKDGPEGPGGPARGGASPESVKKLDQIIQNLYAKAAVLVLQSRLNLTPSAGRRGESKKLNKWFSLDTEETDDFREELRVYKSSGCFDSRPPPLIIETYIDASSLNSSQSMVVVDENGKRWDLLDALNWEDEDDSPRRRQPPARNTEVVLERWRLELKCLSGLDFEDDFGPSLPTVYKRAIVFFRSFFVATRIMPCWKYSQHALSKAAHPALEVKCRILAAEPEYPTYDPLRTPLYQGDGRDVVTEYLFADLEVPVGRFSASVTYRNDCNFRVDDSESLLSSRFMGVDENFFKPSIPQRQIKHGHGRSDSYAEPGSLPAHRHGRGAREPQQTYGSLSTFHGDGALGTSPITALRQVRPIGSDTSSPTESPSASAERPEPPHSLPIRTSAAGRPSLRTSGESSRRTSVSFQPFKAGSLSGSPRLPDMDVPSSPQSLTRPSGLSALARAANRSSLQAGMAASLRGPSLPQEVPLSASPKPGSRYSSSFSHRRARPSFGGQSRGGDDDQASSGKQSLSSSAQPGSGLLADAGAIASSGSFQTDDDNISEFLKALDSHKTLKSFEVSSKKGAGGEPSASAASKRTAAQLSKFQLMRESHNVLSESMTSSMQLTPATRSSTTSSSRQLGNVPGMMNPGMGPGMASVFSTSTSPGKPLSPHTPHTPAIPSRLSENSIIDYHPHQPARGTRGIGATEEEREGGDGETPMAPSAAAEGKTTTTGTGAIDIPLSPRLFHHVDGGIRRVASSAAQGAGHQQRGLDLYKNAKSLEGGSSGKEREVPSRSGLLSGLAGVGLGLGGGSAGSPSPAAEDKDDDVPPANLTGGIGVGTRSRYLGRGRGGSGASGSSRPGSFSSMRAGGFGQSLEAADDEPLLFAMSELEREGRKSLEGGGPRDAGQGGSGSVGGGGSDSKEYSGVRGVLRKGWS